jgi:hypothetical protein
MNDLNALTPQRLAAAGLNLNNASDRSLLTSRLSSPLAQAAGFKAPYATFPLAQTVAQSLRPYPQFLSIPILWSPLGSSWYDALQTKLTKRFSHGLTSSTNFTWAKELALGAEGGTAGQSVNDVYNRQNQKAVSAYSQPFVFVTSTSYTTPKAGPNRWTKFATGDWTLGVVLRYQSGTPIFVPLAQNSQTSYLFRGTVANRVPGQPLFLKDLNCHCFDPNTTPVLNPAAWTDPAPGQWGTSALYYNDFRFARRPSEAANLSRVFNLRENVRLEFQAMFFNIFNRTFLNNPTSTNAKATPVYSNGTLISGFGAISTASTNQLPRTGLLSLRLQF